MVEKSCDKWFEMSAGEYCGVFIKEDTAKKLQKLLWRHTQEVKEFLTANKESIIPADWCLAYPHGKQVIVNYSSTKEDALNRIKLFDGTNRIKYVQGGVFITDEQYISARKEVVDFYMEHYSDD